MKPTNQIMDDLGSMIEQVDQDVEVFEEYSMNNI
jgi:hypothetical protein